MTTYVNTTFQPPLSPFFQKISYLRSYAQWFNNAYIGFPCHYGDKPALKGGLR